MNRLMSTSGGTRENSVLHGSPGKWFYPGLDRGVVLGVLPVRRNFAIGSHTDAGRIVHSTY